MKGNMKQKLFGLALMLVGVVTLLWVILIVILAKGMLALLYGVVPLVAGWIIFNSATHKESPTGTTTTGEGAGWIKELKSGCASIRSFLKNLL